ncbi:MAG: hypothetical protein H8Z69_03875 [Nanohaloarchaea archaeon]|nr:hypothetical protein [Candidatus Nanohaloarchaea archaeon]
MEEVSSLKSPEARIESLEKAVRHLKDKVRELEEQKADLSDRVQFLENKEGKNQPNRKFKVSKRITNDKGELERDFYDERAKNVAKEVMKRGKARSGEFDKILREHDVDVSNPTKLNIMRRYGKAFDFFKFKGQKKGVRKESALIHTP